MNYNKMLSINNPFKTSFVIFFKVQDLCVNEKNTFIFLSYWFEILMGGASFLADLGKWSILSSLVVIPGIAGVALRKPFPPPLRQSLAEAKTEENPQRIQTIHNCSPRFSFPTKQAFSLKVYAPNTPKPKHYKHKRQLFKKQKVKRWKNSHQKTKKKYKKTFGGGDKLLKRDLQTGWLPTAENPAPHPFRSASASS